MCTDTLKSQGSLVSKEGEMGMKKRLYLPSCIVVKFNRLLITLMMEWLARVSHLLLERWLGG